MKASLWALLLSALLLLLQVSADQIIIKAELGQTVILPCRAPGSGTLTLVEWSRTDPKDGIFLLYRNEHIDKDNHPSFKNRVDLLVSGLKDGDASLILKNTTIGDNGIYECRVAQNNNKNVTLISTITLDVSSPPEPFPSWATVLLVLLVLAVAAGLLYHFRHRFMPEDKVVMEPGEVVEVGMEPGKVVDVVVEPGEEVEVESGEESVLLPCKATVQLPRDAKVEWRDKYDYVVHVYQNVPDQPNEQHKLYRNRTDINGDLLTTGDLSLTLRSPTEEDCNTYTCSVLNWKGNVLMKKQVDLKVKVKQVEVESGVESVLLPYRTRVQLPGDARVEWADGEGDLVHLYQNGSDQPEEQNHFYRTRTKINEDPLRTGDLSLTLRLPTDGDSKFYTCRVVNKKGDILLKKQVGLKVKVPQVEVEEGAESVLLPFITKPELLRDASVVWRDSERRKVCLYQNSSAEQGTFYSNRTRMNEDPLKTGVLSLTLDHPTDGDTNTYTCNVSKDKVNLLMKQVHLKVKVPQVEVESGAESVLLPCKTPVLLVKDCRVTWTDGRGRKVHVYDDGSNQAKEQDQFYRTRTKINEDLLKTGDLSLTLSHPTDGDTNTYICRSINKKGVIVMKQRVDLKVKVQQVEVESGVESVLLPCKTKVQLPGDARVAWMDGRERKVHVYEDGSNQDEEQDQFYRTRTKMNEDLLKTGDLSLTLRHPADGGTNIYTCRIFNKNGDIMMMKLVHLKVKVHQVEVKEGAESVRLPFRTTPGLPGDAKVVWRDSEGRKVHVYQNGSGQPAEQDEVYRTRTSMSGDPLKTGDLSLTLRRPTVRDSGEYRCDVWKTGDHLRRKRFQLTVKGTDQVQPEDTSSIQTPLLGVQSV